MREPFKHIASLGIYYSEDSESEYLGVQEASIR